jgi:hypothetical protein
LPIGHLLEINLILTTDLHSVYKNMKGNNTKLH